MSSLVKKSLIFPIVFLALMLFAVPVYATESEELMEQQAEESEESLEEQPQDEKPEEPKVVNTETGIYTLSPEKNISMRSEPSTDSIKILTLPFGINLESGRKLINDKGEEWFEVTYGGLSGYVNTDNVSVEASDMGETLEEPGIMVNEGEAIGEQAQEANAGDNIESISLIPQLTGQIGTVLETDGSNVEALSDNMLQENNTAYDTQGIRKADFIFWIFIIFSIVGLIVIFIVFFILRYEYIRYRKQMLKDIRDNV